jgi:hypothetical protein
MEYLKEHQNVKVVVRGYSKGGAVAHLYTLQCIRSALFITESYLGRIFV